MKPEDLSVRKASQPRAARFQQSDFSEVRPSDAAALEEEKR